MASSIHKCQLNPCTVILYMYLQGGKASATLIDSPVLRHCQSRPNAPPWGLGEVCSVLHCCLTDTKFQLDDVCACCEVSKVRQVGRDVSGLTAHSVSFPCRQHQAVSAGSMSLSLRVLQPNQPQESQSSITRLTTMASPRAISSSPIPLPVPEAEPSIVRPPGYHSP